MAALCRGRLVRLTASGNQAVSQQVLVDDWCQQYPSHSIGDMAFGPDGALYVSGGDGASFNYVDYGQDGSPLNPCGDPPGGVGHRPFPTERRRRRPAIAGPADAGRPDDAGRVGHPHRSRDRPGAARQPSARAAATPTRAGSWLRAPEPVPHGVPSGHDGAVDRRRRLGDVGGGRPDGRHHADATVVNFGWPCYEGPLREGGYDAADLTICENLYASGAVQSPFFAYRHDLDVAPPDDCPPANRQHRSARPLPAWRSTPGIATAGYDGALFGADYSRTASGSSSRCEWRARSEHRPSIPNRGAPGPSRSSGP